MKYSLKSIKYKDLYFLSFERRIALTVVGLFLLVFTVAMGGLNFTNTKLSEIFNEIESRNILAAKKNLEHDLLSWTSSLSLIANSAEISEWYEYKKYGLSREERRYYFKLKKYFGDAEKSHSGLAKISLSPKPCDHQIKILKDKPAMHICANHKSMLLSISAEADLTKVEESIHQFVPNAKIGSKSEKNDLSYSLSMIPDIKLIVKRSNQIAGLIESFSMILPITLGLLLIGILFILFVMWSKLLRAQTNVLNYITNILSGNSPNIVAPQNLGFSDLESTMKGVVDKVIAFEQNQKEAELLNLSKQISHDIRSPLAALNSLSRTLTEMPEEKRILVRNSINRINDIANSLLETGKKPLRTLYTEKSKPEQFKNESDIHMVSSIIDSIVSEKRIQFRELAGIQIEAKTENAYGLFVNVINKELQCIISNLVNNSIEALKGAKGEVTITAESIDQSVLISIQDDGIGIPEEILNQIGERGFSYGKTLSTQSGSGLGIFHAKQKVMSFNGKFKIVSEVNKGTNITIELPKVKAPDWFVNSLNLSSGQTLVICDDDTSIHQIWAGRIKSLQLDTDIKLLSFTSGRSFKSWIEENSMTQFFCLVDFELLNQPQTGLDIIEELGIPEKSVLVTSHYEKADIRNRCDKLGIKLIPKDGAGFVPIQLKEFATQDHSRRNDKIQEIISSPDSTEGKIRYDLCRLDDDKD